MTLPEPSLKLNNEAHILHKEQYDHTIHYWVTIACVIVMLMNEDITMFWYLLC